ncbi:hypothetical protein [Bacillus massilioanorexius]|nr:hypothetical protein [Bacillus massilioanorexius]
MNTFGNEDLTTERQDAVLAQMSDEDQNKVGTCPYVILSYVAVTKPDLMKD